MMNALSRDASIRRHAERSLFDSLCSLQVNSAEPRDLAALPARAATGFLDFARNDKAPSERTTRPVRYLPPADGVRGYSKGATDAVGEAASFPCLAHQRLGKLAASPTAQRQPAVEISRLLAILHQWGIHSLGQLATLEKQELGARLGPVAVQLWERASGKTTRLLKLVTPAESFEEAFEFEQEVETSEPLLFILRRFLQQLAVRLGAFYFVAQELTLQITFANKKSYTHEFKIREPTTNVEVLFRMLQTHLESFKSECPIIAVSLEAQSAKPGQQQFHLFETALRDPAQLAETLARLAGLVGHDRVGTPVLEQTHRPDVFRMEPFRWELRSVAVGELEALPASALRRFRPNPPALVLVDENKPAHLRSGEVQGRVQEGGPYRLSGNWWDTAAWQRAEWDLQLENGTLCRCHSDGEKWQLDGVYD